MNISILYKSFSWIINELFSSNHKDKGILYISFLILSLLHFKINTVVCDPKDTCTQVEQINFSTSLLNNSTAQSIVFVIVALGGIYLMKKGFDWWLGRGNAPVGPSSTVGDDTVLSSTIVKPELKPVAKTCLGDLYHNCEPIIPPDILPNGELVKSILANKVLSPCVVPHIDYADCLNLRNKNLEEIGLVGEKLTPQSLHLESANPNMELVKEVAAAVYENENLARALLHKIEPFKNILPFPESCHYNFGYESALFKLDKIFNCLQAHEISKELFIFEYLKCVNSLVETNLIKTKFVNISAFNQYYLDLLIKHLTDLRLVNGEVFFEYMYYSQKLIAYMDVPHYLLWVGC